MRSAADPALAIGGAAALAAFLAACSVLLEPGRAPPPRCPAGPDSCPARANSVATCQDVACVYDCRQGFLDANGDLGANPSDGCEIDCASLTAPVPAASWLIAEVGPRSGVVTWEWPEVAPGASGAERAARYRLEWDLAAGAYGSSRVAEAGTACVGGLCRAPIEGLQNNLRVYARVRSIDTCGRESAAASSPESSATPLYGEWRTDGETAAAWTRDSSAPTPCPPPTAANGVLTFHHQPAVLCYSRALAGDAMWDDFTMTYQIYLGPGAIYGAGSAIRADPNPYLVDVAASTSAWESPVQIHRPQRLPPVAASVAGLDAGRWIWLRVVASGAEISMSRGDALDSMVEILRWTDPSGPTTGRLGFELVSAFFSAAEVQVRNLTVNTGAELPPRTLKRAFHDFASGIPATMRTVTETGVTVRVVACPNLPEAPGCPAAGACRPVAASRCLEIDNTNTPPAQFLRATAGIDVPVGVDELQPWRVRFKFAALGTAQDPPILRSDQGLLLNVVGDWPANLLALGNDAGAPLATAAWHLVELVFRAGSNNFDLIWNGSSLRFGPYPPAGFSAHLGALWLGAGVKGFGTSHGKIHGYWTEIEVVQP